MDFEALEAASAGSAGSVGGGSASATSSAHSAPHGPPAADVGAAAAATTLLPADAPTTPPAPPVPRSGSSSETALSIPSARSPSAHFTGKATLAFREGVAESSFQVHSFMASIWLQVLCLSLFVALRVLYLIEGWLFDVVFIPSVLLGLLQIAQCVAYVLTAIVIHRVLERRLRHPSVGSSTSTARSGRFPSTPGGGGSTTPATTPSYTPSPGTGSFGAGTGSGGGSGSVPHGSVGHGGGGGGDHSVVVPMPPIVPPPHAHTLPPLVDPPAAGKAAADPAGALDPPGGPSHADAAAPDVKPSAESGGVDAAVPAVTPLVVRHSQSLSPESVAGATNASPQSVIAGGGGSGSATEAAALSHIHLSGWRSVLTRFVSSGAWSVVFVYICIVQALVTSMTDWLGCNADFADAGKTQLGLCRAYADNLFPLPPALGGIINAAAVVGVASQMLVGLAGVTCSLIPFVAQFANFIHPTGERVTTLDITRVSILVVLLYVVFLGVTYMRISSQRTAFASLLSVEEQFAAYEMAVQRWRNAQSMLVSARERVAKATTAQAVGDVTLGYLSHQLRNPLHFLSNAMNDILAHRPSTPLASVHDELEDAQQAAVTMTKVIEDVAAHQALLSGAIEPAPAPVDVRALVRNLVREFEAEYRRRIAVVAADDLPRRLVLDQVRLAQAVANGLANAVAVTPADRNISVHLSRVLAPRMDVGAALELSPSIMYADVGRFVVADASMASYRATLPAGREARPGFHQVRVAGPGVVDPELPPDALQALLVPSVSPRHMARGSSTATTAGTGGTATRGGVAAGAGAVRHRRRERPPQQQLYRGSTGGSDDARSAASDASYAGAGTGGGSRGGGGDYYYGDLGGGGGGGGLPSLDSEASSETVGWFLQIEVRNQGLGLRGLRAAALFNPFGTLGPVTSASIRATGLGLPISRLLAILLRGRVGLYDVYARSARPPRQGERGGGGRPRRVYAYTVFLFQVPLEVAPDEGEGESEGGERRPAVVVTDAEPVVPPAASSASPARSEEGTTTKATTAAVAATTTTTGARPAAQAAGFSLAR